MSNSTFVFLVVDDERLSRSYIRDMIKEFCPLSIIFEASSGTRALEILEKEPVDILFLDVKMTDMNGFELLESVSHKNFDLVFVTAYNDYAINAIKEGAIDYLLKPVKKIDFESALIRLLDRKKRLLEDRSKDVNLDEKYLENKLIVNHQQGIKFILLRSIIYLKADNTYTTIYTTDGEKFVSSKPISRFESILNENWFFRIHKSYIINTHHFKEYISKDGNIAVMDNGQQLYISRYRLNQFLMQVMNNNGELKV